MIDLDNLAALASAATPGPWSYQEDSDAYTHIIRPAVNPGRMIASALQTSQAHGEANGRFIAAANPTVILELVAIARAAADSLPKIDGIPAGWKALSDVQWMNIVNHDRAYESFSKEEAVHEAVKRTEAKCREVNEPRLAPVSQAAPAAEPTAQQIHAAARKMCDLSAEACGVDKDDNWTFYSEVFTDEAKIVLAAALLAGASPVPAAIPEGWQLVPIEPTPEMMRAAWSTANELWNTPEADDPLPGHQYRAMLAAAPAPGERHD